MKRSWITTLMLIVVITVGLQLGCKKGDTGPQGPPGEPSTAIEGFAPGIQCGTCHNADQDTVYHVAAREYQWALSKHAIGGDIERNAGQTGGGCAGCHTLEGFLQRERGEAVTSQPDPSPINCFACHSPHSRGNFTLRDTTPVTIAVNQSGLSNATFDYGHGNMCAQCHKPRSISPELIANPGPTDTLVITTAFWEPHNGLQSAMLMGAAGFKFSGFTYNGNSDHSGNTIIQQLGCPACHMAEAIYPPQEGTGKAGGHTMQFSYVSDAGDTLDLLTGCTQTGCHPTFTQQQFDDIQSETQDSLNVLQALLIQKGWINPTTLEVNASASAPLKIPATKAGALYNYNFVLHDGSMGIHNRQYAMDLLNSSIQALRAQ